MADKTRIEWTDATWNPIVGCTHVSAGCDNCYAARETSGRLAKHPLYAGLARDGKFTGEVRLVPERLSQPLHWRKPRRIFVNSMSDLFHGDVPTEFIAEVFAVMAAASRHQFQVLTKRPGRMRSLLTNPDFHEQVTRAYGPLWRPAGHRWPLPNVWLGTSVEDQHWADVRIPHLILTPASVRFLSCEPLLGPISLIPLRRIDWVIVGGESGPNARPMHPAWARRLRDECVYAGVPFLFKQWGEYLPAEVVDDPRMSHGRAYTSHRGGRSAAVVRERPKGAFQSGRTRLMEPGDVTIGGLMMLDRDTVAERVGKHKAGRELDGCTWDEYPKGAATGEAGGR